VSWQVKRLPRPTPLPLSSQGDEGMNERTARDRLRRAMAGKGLPYGMATVILCLSVTDSGEA